MSAGTGAAPFCGFPGARLAANKGGEEFSPALCFFGVRDPEVDYIFRDAFEAAEAESIVAMQPTFSRAPVDGVKCVQDRITADADLAWELLGNPAKNMHVFVCGDGGRTVPGMSAAFREIFKSRIAADEAAA